MARRVEEGRGKERRGRYSLVVVPHDCDAVAHEKIQQFKLK